MFLTVIFFLSVIEDPEFTDVIENITVPAGRSVKLACSVKNLGSYKVSKRSFILYTLSSETIIMFQTRWINVLVIPFSNRLNNLIILALFLRNWAKVQTKRWEAFFELVYTLIILSYYLWVVLMYYWAFF